MIEQKIKVLYVDDERNNLVSFKAMFRQDYQVFTANNPAEVFEVLEKNPELDIVIMDQRMPGKTGVELFGEIRQKYPMPVRMLCTGYSDIEAVINAINKGHVFRYIQKPWSEADIKSAMEEGYKYYQATSLLAETNCELLKANTELDRFSHTVTHELRSPILSVLGAISIAQDTHSIKEVKDMLSIIGKTMLKLDSFIYNLQDYYAIKRGELQIAPIHFGKLMNDLKDMYEVNIKTNHIKFSIEIDAKDVFYSDEILLSIILNNLISNAFKYQRKDNGDKWVHLKITTEKDTVTISVCDNGIGIEDNNLEDIFTMSYRANTEEVGTGFGLYNVKDALKKLGGKINVNSKKNEGTEFQMIIKDYRQLIDTLQ